MSLKIPLFRQSNSSMAYQTYKFMSKHSEKEIMFQFFMKVLVFGLLDVLMLSKDTNHNTIIYKTIY
jgi:hypothetical protein